MATKSEKQIHQILNKNNEALSHQEILKLMVDPCNRVTLYRTLDRMQAEDKVHRIIDHDGVSKYALCFDKREDHSHDHIHFSCTKCGKVQCIEEVVPSFNLPKGYKIEETHFTLTGTCPECK